MGGGCAATGDSPMNVLEMYELEVSKLSAICHYADFRDKATKTEISVFGRQALGAQRRRSPSLAGKVLRMSGDFETGPNKKGGHRMTQGKHRLKPDVSSS